MATEAGSEIITFERGWEEIQTKVSTERWETAVAMIVDSAALVFIWFFLQNKSHDWRIILEWEMVNRIQWFRVTF